MAAAAKSAKDLAERSPCMNGSPDKYPRNTYNQKGAANASRNTAAGFKHRFPKTAAGTAVYLCAGGVTSRGRMERSTVSKLPRRSGFTKAAAACAAAPSAGPPSSSAGCRWDVPGAVAAAGDAANPMAGEEVTSAPAALSWSMDKLRPSAAGAERQLAVGDAGAGQPGRRKSGGSAADLFHSSARCGADVGDAAATGAAAGASRGATGPGEQRSPELWPLPAGWAGGVAAAAEASCHREGSWWGAFAARGGLIQSVYPSGLERHVHHMRHAANDTSRRVADSSGDKAIMVAAHPC